MHSFHPKFWFGQVDSRPLSVFRVFFAALLVKDALYHLALADDFFSDTGYVPRSALLEGLARADRFSLMDAMPYGWMAVAFFALWAGVAFCLLLGYRTRLMALLNFVLMLSVHERNIYVLNGADTVMRVVSFWVLFLPIGRHYSLDALRSRCANYARSRRLRDLRVEAAVPTTFTFPLRALQLQIAMIYLFSGMARLPVEAWRTGDALFYALQLKSLTLPGGDFLLAASPLWLLRAFSHFMLLAEIMFPLLLFAPLAQPLLRAMGLALAALLHLSIAATMSVPNFSPVMLISCLVFCEARWLLALGRRLGLPRERSALALPRAGSPLWLALSATSGQEIALDRTRVDKAGGCDSWVIYSEHGQGYKGAAAWQRLAGHLPLNRLWAWTLRSNTVRRLVWNVLSMCVLRMALPQPAHGARAGQAQLAALTPRVVRAQRAALSMLLGALIVGVGWWNLAHLVDQDERELTPPLPAAVATMLRFTGLWQGWDMLPPYPALVDGWVVAPGKFEDGSSLELRSGQAVNDQMERWFWGPDARWKRYEANLSNESYQPLYFAWAARYCHEYNILQARPEGMRLATVELHFRYLRSHAPASQPNPYEARLLWKHWCYPESQH